MHVARFVGDEELTDKLSENAGITGVVFWDHWSVPCKYFLPEIDDVTKMYKGKIPFYKIDTLENPDVTSFLGVEACPTLLLFKDGEEIARYEGPYSREALQGRIDALLTRNK